MERNSLKITLMAALVCVAMGCEKPSANPTSPSNNSADANRMNGARMPEDRPEHPDMPMPPMGDGPAVLVGGGGVVPVGGPLEPAPIIPVPFGGGGGGDGGDWGGGGDDDGGEEIITEPHKPVQPRPDDWPRWGQNTTNNSHNAHSKMSQSDAEKLSARCAINYRPSGVQNISTANYSNQPIIVNDVIYWTGFGGFVGAHKLIRDEHGQIDRCDAMWEKKVSTILDIVAVDSEPSARISPAYYVTQHGKGALLYIAVSNPFMFDSVAEAEATPLFAFGLDALTGDQLFLIEVAAPATIDPDNASKVNTSSPAIFNGMAFFGISSFNNVVPGQDITFRGQIVALDLYGTGNDGVPYVKWRQFTIPPRPDGYIGDWFAGGGVWGSAPSILSGAGKNGNGLVFVGSGNLYLYPNFTAECMTEAVAPITFNSFVADQRGETGGGEKECYRRSVNQLELMGIEQPLANNSIIGLNIEDGSFAWHYNTQGIDAWQSACGTLSEGGPGCTVPVAGPDWDTGGGSPVLAKVDDEYRIISHNKGGVIFVLDAHTGKKIYDINMCTGSPLGGIHWGLSYDPEQEQILASCSGGADSAGFGVDAVYRQVLADGTVVCGTGFMNAIDVHTGRLKYQVVPAQPAPLPPCPTENYTPDLRFKSGIVYDIVYDNQIDPNVVVNYMPFSPNIPVQFPQEGRMHSAPTSTKDMIFTSVLDGTVYVVDSATGTYINQIWCDEGGIYQGVSVTSDAVSFGCGYAAFGAELAGTSVMVYGVHY